CYELPHSHRPVVTLVVRLKERIIYDTIVGKPGSSASEDQLKRFHLPTNLTISEHHVQSLRYQQSCKDSWDGYQIDCERNRKDVLSRLATGLWESLRLFHEDKGQVTPKYGELVDQVIDSVQQRLTQTERESFPQLD